MPKSIRVITHDCPRCGNRHTAKATDMTEAAALERERIVAALGKHRIKPDPRDGNACVICLRPIEETGDYRGGRYRHLRTALDATQEADRD